MAKDTKERILAAALEQFSQNGYAGTNITPVFQGMMDKGLIIQHFIKNDDTLERRIPVFGG